MKKPRYTWDGHALHFESLPFITGVRSERALAPGLLEYLPFTLHYDSSQGIIAQRTDALITRQLNLAYQKGSMISTPLGSGSLSTPLADEILDLLQEICGPTEGRSFFEPGCGTGYLLSRLKKKGAKKVLGCDPGPQAQTGIEKYGLDILQSRFEPARYDAQFDCVYHYGVLEHVEEPEAFLRDSLACIREGGIHLAIVPDCEADFSLGNLNILAHEHINYFTRQSLVRLFQSAGFSDIKAMNLQYSNGMLCVWGKAEATSHPVRLHDATESEKILLRTFAKKTCERVLPHFFKQALASQQVKKPMGLYGAPNNFSGLLSGMCGVWNFDGDVTKHGLSFSGSEETILSPEKITEKELSEMWVLPIHHDKAIREHLNMVTQSKSDTPVSSLLDFLHSLDEQN